jgi:hypothetical protein
MVISKCFGEAQQRGEARGILTRAIETLEKSVFRSQRMFKTPVGLPYP